ncbi:hypothetical protein [Streptomyces spiramyceticus]|uniref:hypothetical protein n=1 Tax=Streptomyces spiramyceticus TaxID=299717 RepID=UPI00237B0376|nr:hypothetical protein [Streptomyces spiramyceticus]
MTRLTNSISGGVHHGVTIQGGDFANLDFASDGTNVSINGRTATPDSDPQDTAAQVAELRAELDRPGPRLAVLTKGESAAVYALLALVAGTHPELDPIAEELAGRISTRAKEYES